MVGPFFFQHAFFCQHLSTGTVLVLVISQQICIIELQITSSEAGRNWPVLRASVNDCRGLSYGSAAIQLHLANQLHVGLLICNAGCRNARILCTIRHIACEIRFGRPIEDHRCLRNQVERMVRESCQLDRCLRYFRGLWETQISDRKERVVVNRFSWRLKGERPGSLGPYNTRRARRLRGPVLVHPRFGSRRRIILRFGLWSRLGIRGLSRRSSGFTSFWWGLRRWSSWSHDEGCGHITTKSHRLIAVSRYLKYAAINTIKIVITSYRHLATTLSIITPYHYHCY